MLVTENSPGSQDSTSPVFPSNPSLNIISISFVVCSIREIMVSSANQWNGLIHTELCKTDTV